LKFLPLINESVNLRASKLMINLFTLILPACRARLRFDEVKAGGPNASPKTLGKT